MATSVGHNQEARTSQASPEYQTLQKNISRLVNCVKEQPDDFCDHCFQEQYFDVREFVRNESKLKTEKARKIVDTLIDRVEHEPKIFHGFMESILKTLLAEDSGIVKELEDCLKKEQMKGKPLQELDNQPREETFSSIKDMSSHELCDWLTTNKIPIEIVACFKGQDVDGDTFIELPLDENVLNQKLKCTLTLGVYNKLKKLLRKAKGVLSQSNSIFDEETKNPTFSCPTCEKCSIEQYFSNKGCPEAKKHSTTKKPSLFPFLNFSNLTKDEQEALESQLETDTRSIICLFAKTENKFISSLKSRTVDIEQLRNFAKHFVMTIGTEKDVECLETSKTISSIFSNLHPCKSFFNFEIIKEIVQEFGSEEDKELMRKYIDEFNRFCKRSVFQVPSNIFHGRSPQPGQKVFTVKFSPKEHARLENVVTVRKKLAEILEIQLVALQLSSITDGCVCLWFIVPFNLLEKVFPLSKQQVTALHEINVRIEERSESTETREMKTQELVTYLPNWNERPPDSYPFEPINFTQVILPASLPPLYRINDCGEGLLKAGDHQNALWKFEYCLIIAKRRNDLKEIIKCSSNCALALLMFREALEDPLKKKKLLELCKKFCLELNADDATENNKIFYQMGEALELEGNSKEAVHYYRKCCHFKHDLMALSKIILLNETTPEILLEFNFARTGLRLTKLFQLLLKSDGFFSVQLKTFIHLAKLTDRRNFLVAVKQLPAEIGVSLLRLLSGDTQSLLELFQLLSLHESQIVLLAEEGDEFVCALLDRKEVNFTESIMAKLSEKSRTQYLVNSLEQKNIKQALLLLNSGNVDPTKVNLSAVSIELFLHTQLVESLLKCQVDPHGLMNKQSDKSPLENLAIRCPHEAKKKQQREKRSEIVQAMKLLIDAGAEVQDLSSYNQGSQTTPLHVATELAILTGDTDFLVSVHKKWLKPLSLTDKDNKTPLHTAAQNSQYCSSSTLIIVWKFLEDECNINPSSLDNKKRAASFYLPKEIREQIQMKTDLYTDEEEVVSKYMPNPQPLLSSTAEVSPAISNQQLMKSSVTLGTITHSLAGDLDMIDREQQDSAKCKTSEKAHNQQLLSEQVQHSSEFKSPKKKKGAGLKVESGYITEYETEATKIERFATLSELQTQISHLEKQYGEYFSLEKAKATKQTDSKEVARCHAKETCLDNRFNLNFEDQPWEIEIHESVAEFTKNKMQPYELRKEVLKNLFELAKGHWNMSNHKLSDNDTIEIYEAKLSKGALILYQIATRFSTQLTQKLDELQLLSDDKSIHVYTQAIVVWEVVLNYDKLQHSVQHIKNSIQKLKHPKANSISLALKTGKQQQLPQIFVNHSKLEPQLQLKINNCLRSVTTLNFSEDITEYDLGKKVYSLTTQLAFSFLDDERERKDCPIKVTDEEYDIIKLPSSKPVVVLGRSGTGKTTTCLNRLWLNFYHWIERGNPSKLESNQDHPSAACAEAFTTNIEVVTSTMVATDSANCIRSSTDTKTYKDLIQTSFQKTIAAAESRITSPISEHTHLHQLFITKNHALCMKMKKKFFDFVAGCTVTKDYLSMESYSLPDTLSGVQHFPIFLTAREFFIMLDNSLGNREECFLKPNIILESSGNQADSHSLKLLFEQSEIESDEETDEPQDQKQRSSQQVWREITATEFTTEIWPRISKYCSDPKIDPLLIWTEIESFIKGSVQALRNKNGCISDTEYYEFSDRQSNFTTEFRREVYNLFIEYQNQMRHKDATQCRFDNGDFVWHLNKRLSDTGTNVPWTIHELYIDEVQDFTQAELSVILKCCKNPNRSFFAGDTAQTIMQGVAFRFEDLTSLLYNFKSNCGIDCAVREVHKLTTNHRSHASITELANSLIDLLKKYFPDALDWRNIPKDQSNIKGPMPLFIYSKPLLDNFLISQGLGEQSSVEFGADQVVIARDSSEDGRAKMPDYLQDQIVLNPQECKGLEFNDVLLYNIFTDTPDQKKEMWKLSATYLKEELPETAAKETLLVDVHSIEFREKRHKSFCAQLKMLYTIVTRAKRHIWIYEDSPPQDLPMLEYWCKKDLIRVVTEHHDFEAKTGDSNENTHVKCTIDEWKKQGDVYMEKKLWHAAKKCYQKANESSLENLAHAHVLEKKSMSTKYVDVPQLQSLALIFIKSFCQEQKKEHLKNAAICLYRAKRYPESIRLFELIQEYSDAVYICKEHQRKDLDTLVRLTGKRGRYKAAIRLFLKREKYDAALKLAHEYVSKKFLKQEECYQMLKDVIYKQIKRVIQGRLYTQNKDLLKYVEIIPDTTEQMYFLKQAKMYEEVCLLLERNKLYDNAYRICRAQHLYSKGIKIAKSVGSRHKAFEYTMTLLSAEHQLLCSPESSQDETRKNLEKILTAQNSETKHKAKASLLLSVIVSASDDRTDRSLAMKLCTDAWDTYRSIKSKAGEIEAFHFLTRLRVKRGEHTVQHGEKLLDTISIVEKVCVLLRKHAASLTTNLSDIEEFYSFEKHGSKLYCVPKKHGFFMQPTYAKNALIDADGMLQLDKKSVLKQIEDHYLKLAESWRKYVKYLKVPWETKIKLSFPFHSELLVKPFYLQREHRMFPPKQISDFLHMCEIALQLCKLNTAIVESSVIGPFQNLLSPFSQLSLPFQPENYLLIRKSETFQACLVEKFSQELQKMFRNTQKIPSIDRWLLAWKIMHIMGKDAVAKMNNEISKQKHKVSAIVKSHVGYFPSDQIPFTYIQIEGSYQSIFAMWEWSSKLYREGRALIATRISFAYFIQVIARRKHLYGLFSIENLINILSLQSTALFAIISAAKFEEKQQNIMIIPESFEMMAKSFDLVNCESVDHFQLLTGCYKTSQEVSSQIVLQRSWKLLRDILFLLTGMYKREYWPLKETLVNGTDTEVIHCLVLTLTIFGNLVSYGELSLCDCQILYSGILELFHHKAISQNRRKTMLPEIYFKMVSIKNTKQLFEKVVQPLLKKANLNHMLLHTVINLGKPKVAIRTYLSRQIPQVDFKWEPFQIPSQFVAESQRLYSTEKDLTSELSAVQESQEEISQPSTEENVPGTESIVNRVDEQRQFSDLSVSDNAESNQSDASETKSTDSVDQESEDDDVREELSAAAVAEIKLEKVPEPDPKLEEEKSLFLYEARCIICNIELEEIALHFKSQRHLIQKRSYQTYENALFTYNFTQKHLVELIESYKSVECTDYELERAAMNAEQLIKSNNEKIANQDNDFNWSSKKFKLEKLRDNTSLVITNLDNLLKQAKRLEESAEAEHPEKEKGDDQEDIRDSKMKA